MEVLELLIGGEHIHATGGRTFTRENPLTGETATIAAAASVDDAMRAADAAAAAFPGWSETGPGERRALMNAAADALQARAEDIVAAMADEIGATKP